MSVPHGIVKDWRKGEVEAVPGVTMPKFVVVERDYTAIGAKMSALGPLVEKLGHPDKGRQRQAGPRGGGPGPHQRGDRRRCRRRSALAGHRHPRVRDDPGALGNRPTAASPSKASASSRSAPVGSWPISRSTTRASGSPSRTLRRDRSPSSPVPSGPGPSTVVAATPRSPSTWTGSSRGTP